MVRAIVLYDEEPDAARYEQHVELCRRVPGGTFRHGRVFGAPMGDPADMPPPRTFTEGWMLGTPDRVLDDLADHLMGELQLERG